jgi:hypothetical protein
MRLDLDNLSSVWRRIIPTIPYIQTNCTECIYLHDDPFGRWRRACRDTALSHTTPSCVKLPDTLGFLTFTAPAGRIGVPLIVGGEAR